MKYTYYKGVVNFIKKNYRGQQKKRLINYFNSDLFTEELNILMANQIDAGESISKEFASECLIESQANREGDEYRTTSI